MAEQQMPEITGEQIRNLRQNLGMTHLTFAKGLDVPIWLVEILEQERADTPSESEQAVQLAQIIPERMRKGFYQKLLKKYGRPESWETFHVNDTSSNAASFTQATSKELDEMTLFLPVTVSVQMTMEWLDVLLREYESHLPIKAGNDKVTSYLIISLIQLHQLFCLARRAQGDAYAANNNTALLRNRISQRIRMLEDEY